METRHRFVVLDGLRGVAALSVVMLHLGQNSSLPWRSEAGCAVDLFFVLSGFVLAQAYDANFAAGMTAPEFIRIRYIRLFPLTAIGLTIVILAASAGSFTGADTSAIFLALKQGLPANFFILPSFDVSAQNMHLFSYNAPAWSIFFELVANAMFAIAWRWLNARTLLAIIVMALLALIASDILIGDLDGGWSASSFGIGLARVMFSFPLGILLSRTYRDGTSFNPWLVLAVAALALNMPPTHRQFYEPIFAAVLSPAIVWYGAQSAPGNAAPLFSFLGTISYAVYILAWPLMYWWWFIIAPPFGGVNAHPLILATLYLLTLLPVAWALTRWGDKPMRAALMRIGTTAAIKAP